MLSFRFAFVFLFVSSCLGFITERDFEVARLLTLKERVEQIPAEFGEQLSLLKNVRFDASISQKRQNLPQACITALTNWGTLFTTGSCSDLTTFYTKIFTGDSITNAETTQVCESQCLSDAKGNLTEILSTCPSDFTTDYSGGFDEFFKYLRSVCIKYNQEYCAPKIAAVFSDPTVFVNPTANDLQSICHPCLNLWINTLGQEGADFQSFFCLKEGNKWCWIEFNNINNNIDISDFASFFDKMCSSSCYQRYLALSQRFVNSTDQISMPDLCVRDFNGDLCFSKIYSAISVDSDSACPENPTPSSSCPSSCKDLLKRMFGIGCCGGYFFRLLEQSSDGEFDVDVIRNYVEDSCGIDIPGACPTGRIVGVIVVKNIKYAWVKSNENRFRRALIRDIAANLAAVGEPTITEITETSDGIQIKFTVNYDSKEEADSIQSSVSKLGDSEWLLPSVGGLPVDSRVDPLSPASIDTSASSFQSETVDGEPSGSSALGLSFAVLFLALFFF